MEPLRSVERSAISLLLIVALATFFFPLMTMQIPILGSQDVTGYDFFSKTRQFRQQLASMPSTLSESKSESTQPPAAVAHNNEPPLPLSLQLASLVPFEVTLAFVCALFSLPVCFYGFKRANVRVTSTLGGVAAAASILNLNIINSDLHSWLQDSIEAASGNLQNDSLAGFPQQIGSLIVRSFQIKPGSGLYALAGSLILVAFLSYSGLLAATRNLDSNAGQNALPPKRMPGINAALIVVVLLSAAGIVSLLVGQLTQTIVESSEGLFQLSRSCPMTHQWTVDFSGDGSTYRVEQHHCGATQLSNVEFAKELNIDKTSVNGYDFVLVIKPHILLPDQLVHGEFSEYQYSAIEPVVIGPQPLQSVILEGAAEGSGGFTDWCLLAIGKNGDVTCWREQQGDVQRYVRKYLRPGEGTDAWHLGAEDGKLYESSNVWEPENPHCCPTGGWVQVELNPKDGVLYWSEVLRGRTKQR